MPNKQCPPATTTRKKTIPFKKSRYTASASENNRPPASYGGTPDNQKLKIATINIQSCKSNKVYLEKIIHQYDIVCIQETWLYEFESNMLHDLSPNHCVTSKSSDKDDPIPPTERARGHGGVAIIWKDTHDNIVQPLEDGGVRINVIEIKTPEPLIIVNSYLPARNGGQKDQYLEILDELSEIIYKYSPTHRIVIMGDMNASLFRTPPNVQDQMFRSFCTKHNINISDLYPKIDTFFHHNGKHSASLDYILQVNNQGLVSDVRVQTDDPVNLSDHKVVEATIDIEIKSNKIKSPSSIPQGRKNWEKCDVQIYRENIKVELEKQPKSIYQVGENIQELIKALKIAEERALNST